MNGKYLGWSVIGAVLVMIFAFAGKLVEVLPANEVMVLQYPSGKLEAFTSPGVYAQWFGTATHYPKRESYEIDKQTIWFNDGGTAKIDGNVQFDVPTDGPTLLAMHSKFSSPETVMSKLVAPAFIKSLNASGSLMSSREAFAERRAELQHDIDDQMAFGTWQIRVAQVTETEPLTREAKTLNKGEVVRDSKGNPVRYEKSPLDEFGVKTFGLTVANIDYDERVKKQIQQQQDITMQVQTAIASAKKAEQDVITTQKQGEALAAKAKWEKEADRAAATTTAQKEYDVAELAAKQKLSVAKLDAESAEQEKQAKILRGQGDAEARKLILAADNALDKRLDAWTRVQGSWANAIMNSKTPLVPSVVMGGSGQNGAAISGAQEWLSIIGAKAANDLALDMSMKAPAK